MYHHTEWRTGYPGDARSLLSQRRINKSSKETWGDLHRHARTDWQIHTRLLQKVNTARVCNLEWNDLFDKYRKQLEVFKPLEEEFAGRSGLKRYSVFNSGFFKRSRSHIRSLEEINKALKELLISLGADRAAIQGLTSFEISGGGNIPNAGSTSKGKGRNSQ